jgi:hypothetical protein
MKNKSIPVALAMLLSCLISCSGPGNDTSISINDSENLYKLTAYFPEDKTARVKRYINSCISEEEFFTPGNDPVDITADLKDNTRFHIKSKSGRLLIEIKKSENTRASLERIKKMCEGIKKVLAES